MRRSVFVCVITLVVTSGAAFADARFQSHPPMRPLPEPAARPQTSGSAHYVHPTSGNDSNDGSKSAPWRTLHHAARQLKPGDTLYLRGGVYFEHAVIELRGTADKPITIRSYPNELAVIDGGLREFFESPATAWEPVVGGARGEFRSTKSYPKLGAANGVNLLGRFGDSMIPLHGYRYLQDLRSSNVYWNIDSKTGDDATGIYCGPGVYYDSKTGRIHVRLAPTGMKYLSAADNYQGETDPRKLKLVLAGLNQGSPLVIRRSTHLRLQDLVVRGARTPTVEIAQSSNILIDGATLYGGSTALAARDTIGLRIWNTACRGIAAPWTFRGSLKYRSIEAKILSAGGWGNRDWELAYCEFTDCVDGVFIGNVRDVRFHHNLVDNVSDDGMFLTATTAYDGTANGGNIHIYQNRFSRCLTTFAFGAGHGRQRRLKDRVQTGAGLFIYRNIFDFRRAVHYHQPGGPDVPQEVTSAGRMTGDHGGPIWEPMTIYHNTILARSAALDYFGGLAGHVSGGAKRRVFNNILLQLDGRLGARFPQLKPPAEKVAKAEPKKKDPLDSLLDGPGKKKKSKSKSVDPKTIAKIKKQLAKPGDAPIPIDFAIDGNVIWNLANAKEQEVLKKFRSSPVFTLSKRKYAPGWTANDRFANPRLNRVSTDWKQACDLCLAAGSPAVNSGLSLPAGWSDPLRKQDRGRPDVGAVPVGVKAWRIGVRGRFSVFGETLFGQTTELKPKLFAPAKLPAIARYDQKPTAIVIGYPAPDSVLVQYAIAQRGARVELFDKKWLETREYGKYGMVVIVGDLRRARMQPYQFSKDDFPRLRTFVERGGTLLLIRNGLRALGPSGRLAFLNSRTSFPEIQQLGSFRDGTPLKIKSPTHDWVKHLAKQKTHPWLSRPSYVITAKQGETLIGDEQGRATLYQLKVGKGRVIVVGWSLHESMPKTRSRRSTFEEDESFQNQMQILLNIARDVYP